MGLKRCCPECNTEMAATGRLFRAPVSTFWYVEYYCPKDRELLQIWARETQSLAEAAPKVAIPAAPT